MHNFLFMYIYIYYLFIKFIETFWSGDFTDIPVLAQFEVKIYKDF